MAQEKSGKKLMILLLIGAAVCFVYSVWNSSFREKERITYLEKQDAGSGEETIALQAVIDGQEPLNLEFRIPSVGFTEEEAAVLFAASTDGLDKILPGEGNSYDRVTKDIALPNALPDSPVSLEWVSSQPAVLSSEGKIGSVSEEGETVTLTCRMTLDSYEDEVLTRLVVFPKEIDEGDARKLQTAAEKLNDDPVKAVYDLPQELEGKNVIWYAVPENKAAVLSVIFLLAAVFLVVRKRKQKENAEAARNAALKKAYPELVSRILLLSYAGLSLRKVMFRIASRYQDVKKTGRDPSASAMPEEIGKICMDLKNGMSEPEAYE